MKKVVIVTILICIIQLPAYTHDEGHENNKFYAAFISGDMKLWEKELNALFSSNVPESDSAKLKKLEYTFGYIGWCISDSINEEAKVWFNRFKKTLESESKSDKINKCDIDIYKNALLCYSVILENKNLMITGSRAYIRTKEIIEKYPDNYFARILMSKIVLNMPKKLGGGSRQKAIDYLRQAIVLMEGDGVDSNNWLYLNTLINIADLYRQESDFIASETFINKIRLKEPSISNNVIKAIRDK